MFRYPGGEILYIPFHMTLPENTHFAKLIPTHMRDCVAMSYENDGTFTHHMEKITCVPHIRCSRHHLSVHVRHRSCRTSSSHHQSASSATVVRSTQAEVVVFVVQ